MFSEDLRQARMSLLKGGLAPKYVRRMIGELEAHFSDTRDALLAQGFAQADADQEAAARIGDLRVMVGEALARRELQSFVSLHPRIAFLLGPLASYLLVLLVFIALFAGLLWIRPLPAAGELPAGFRALLQTLGAFYMYLLPLLLSAALLVAARSRPVPMCLTAAAILLVALVGSMLTMSLHAPGAPGEPGSISVTLTLLGYFPGADTLAFPFIGRDLSRVALTLLFSGALWWLSARMDHALAS